MPLLKRRPHKPIPLLIAREEGKDCVHLGVNEPRKQEILSEMNELARKCLESALTECPVGFDVGSVAVVFEAIEPDGARGVGYQCSDDRAFIQAELLRKAADLAEAKVQTEEITV